MATTGRLALLAAWAGAVALPGLGAAGEGEAEGVDPGLGEAELHGAAGGCDDAGLFTSDTARTHRAEEGGGIVGGDKLTLVCSLLDSKYFI